MKKLKKFSILKRLSILSGVLALIGAFGLCLFSSFKEDHNKAQSVSAVSNEPPSTDIYNYYSSVSTQYYFDWTYLTYNVSNSNSASLRSLSRSNYRQLTNTPTDLYGLVYVFNVGNDENIYSEMNNQFYSLVTDFYSYYQDVNNYGATVFEKYRQLSFTSVGNTSDLHMQIRYYYGTGSQDYRLTYDNLDAYKWKFGYARNLIFTSSFTDSTRISLLERFGTFYQFYEFNSLIHQVNDLESEVSDLEAQVSSLESDVSSLSSQITSLNNQISDLRRQLNTAVLNARRDTYIIDIKTEYELVIDAYVNIENSFDYYIVPKRIVAKSSIDVSDATGDIVERHSNLVDSFDFQYLWYYRPVDLLTFLYVNISDSWLLHVPYYSGSENYSYFDLTNVNYYIQNWLLDFKTDISFSENVYFRNQVYNYCLLIADFVSSNSMIYEDGFNIGYDNGFNNGRQEGYSQGKADGFADGVAMDSTVFTIFNGILTVAMVPVNFFLAIFNFEILGINLSGFIRALITVVLTIIILRTIFGSKGGNE